MTGPPPHSPFGRPGDGVRGFRKRNTFLHSATGRSVAEVGAWGGEWVWNMMQEGRSVILELVHRRLGLTVYWTLHGSAAEAPDLPGIDLEAFRLETAAREVYDDRNQVEG